MAFLQRAARRSLRDGLRCLACAGNHLYHWGLKKVARSTVADANSSRPAAFFQDLFSEMNALCRPAVPGHRFRFKSRLFILDATTIKLCLSLFPWASFRQKKGGVKLHAVLDHKGYIPAFVTVSEARVHESRVARALELHKGSITVFDKGYVSYSWFRLLGAKGVFFVTRLKRNAVYRLLEPRPVRRKDGVTSDYVIEVNHKE